MTRETWDTAYDAYLRAKAAHEAAASAYSSGEEAAHRDYPPDGERFFAEYRILVGGDPKSAEIATRMAIQMRDYRDKDDLSAEELQAIDAEAEKVLADLADYRRSVEEANVRHRVKPLSDECDAACDAYCDARRAFLATPAPDERALLAKLEAVAEYDDDNANGTQNVLEDAQRLFGGG